MVQIGLILKSIGLNLCKSSFLLSLITVIILLECGICLSIDSSFHVFFLDVGQGDSILIKTPDYRYILVDGGEDIKVLEELGEVMPFWLQRIDLVIGTHSDSDHIGGLTFVLEKYSVDKFAACNLNMEDANVKRISEILTSKKIETLNFCQKDSFNLGGLQVDAVWPPRDLSGSDNAMSLVLKLVYENYSFLLTGDIESSEEPYIENDLGHINVLKVSHHGSNTATSEDFARTIKPEFSVISVGEGNKYGHPSEEIVNRLKVLPSKIFITKSSGRIDFYIRKGRLSIKLEKR